MPTWEQLRERINAVAEERCEWAGAPLPIDKLRLVVEPRYPYQGLNGAAFDVDDSRDEDLQMRNSWKCRSRGVLVAIFQESDGTVTKCLLGNNHNSRLEMAINTLGAAASPAWSIEAELAAQVKLRDLVGEHKFKCYLMCGMFLETSKRSGITYVFRRLRPTLALRSDGESMRCLCALCLHPIGYYEQSFAGVMVPTDCVIAHLMLMRADEWKYWQMSNQHAADASEAGI